MSPTVGTPAQAGMLPAPACRKDTGSGSLRLELVLRKGAVYSTKIRNTDTEFETVASG